MSEIARVGYTYDENMLLHKSSENGKHPENPDRLRKAYEYLKSTGVLERCLRIESRMASYEELKLVHTDLHINEVKDYSSKDKSDVCKLRETWRTYICDDTYISAAYAAGCVLSLTDAVCQGKIDRAVAIVRPPGHHAEPEETCGFCYFNNIAIAAMLAKTKYGVGKIAIVDWDIHHGNGLQSIFYDDPNVLYISLHRFDNGDYFPQQKDGNYDYVGLGAGEGFNVNIPWNRDMMGNTEYRDAFQQIVEPILRQFQPDLSYIACGFDAAAADIVGEYVLTPEMFGFMTRRVLDCTIGRVVLCLEGGYNPTAVGQGLESCISALLAGDEPRVVFESLPCKRATRTIGAVIAQQSKYWKLDDVDTAKLGQDGYSAPLMASFTVL